MDLVTHALLGAAVARAAATRRSRLATRERLLLGGAAAAFPDIDFIGFPVDPLRYLADWHQGPTHSLVLLPLWAALLAAAHAALSGRRGVFGEAAWVCALAIASHIAADLVTAYGTAVFHPLSAARPALGITFVIDPLFTAIVLAALALSVRSGQRAPVVVGLASLCLYVGAQAWLHQTALQAGRESLRAAGITVERLSALAQPFSPLNWKLIAVDGEHYRQAYVNLAGHRPLVPPLPGLGRLNAIAAAYEPLPSVRWQSRHRHGERPELRPLVEQLWGDVRFEPFRRFAAFPAVSRIDDDGERRCVWFTDLRYDLPALPDTFRYGFCRDGEPAPWRLYRLRYFSERASQPLQRQRRLGRGDIRR